MPGLIETLERAAEIIDQSAEMIEGDALYINKREITEFRRVAKALRKIAAYHKPNPLGGSAKVFDAMADRIRAGDGYHETLADFGFQVVKGRGK